MKKRMDREAAHQLEFLKHGYGKRINMDEIIRAVGYARVSSDEQKKKRSIRPQFKIIEDHIKEKRYSFVGGFKDDGKTGTVETGRKLSKILEWAKEDKFDILLIVKWDRLHKNLREQLNFIHELEKLGKSVYAIQDVNVIVMRNIIGALAEEESSRTSERVHRGYNYLAEKGIYPSSLYGYKKSKKTRKLTPHPIESEKVRKAIKLCLEGKSIVEIVKLSGVPRTNFYYIINNRAYTSFIDWKGKAYPITYEALFSEKDRLGCLKNYWCQRRHIVGKTDSEFLEVQKRMIEDINQKLKDLKGLTLVQPTPESILEPLKKS